MNLRRSLDGIGRGLFVTGQLATRDILGEEAFHRMISHERRRTERSHKPFLLMLLDMGDVMSADNGTISGTPTTAGTANFARS